MLIPRKVDTIQQLDDLALAEKLVTGELFVIMTNPILLALATSNSSYQILNNTTN